MPSKTPKNLVDLSDLGLNIKQSRILEHLPNCDSFAEAARKAGYSDGTVAEVRRNPKMKEAVERLKQAAANDAVISIRERQEIIAGIIRGETEVAVRMKDGTTKYFPTADRDRIQAAKAYHDLFEAKQPISDEFLEGFASGVEKLTEARQSNAGTGIAEPGGAGADGTGTGSRN